LYLEELCLIGLSTDWLLEFNFERFKMLEAAEIDFTILLSSD